MPTKRQQIEDKILTDLLFGAKTYGSIPEYKEKVQAYFNKLILQVDQTGRLQWEDGTCIACEPSLIRHFAQRYGGAS